MEFKKGQIKNILLIVTFTLFLFWGLQNLYQVPALVGWVFNVINPILLGLALAFICNTLIDRIETYAYPRADRKFTKVWPHIRRPISVLLSFLILLCLVALIIFIIVPELIRTVTSLAGSIPGSLNSFQKNLLAIGNRHPEIKKYISQINLDWSSVGTMAAQYGKQLANVLIGSTITITTGLFRAVLTAIFAVVIAVNILLKKEKLKGQLLKLMRAYLPDCVVKKAIYIGGLTNRTFSNFLIGQCTEACILATLCFVGMLIFRFPYAPLISILVGFMALIPMIGPFLSVSIGALLILVVDPVKALWFIVFFIVLQQIEGNLIYPHVVGSRVGLPVLWVLVAVIIGGNTFGVIGMIVSVPLCSVLYVLIRENVNKRLTS